MRSNLYLACAFTVGRLAVAGTATPSVNFELSCGKKIKTKKSRKHNAHSLFDHNLSFLRKQESIFFSFIFSFLCVLCD